MNITVTRDPQTGLTSIVLDDQALDMLDDVLGEFDEREIRSDSLATVAEKRAAFDVLMKKVNETLPYEI